VQHDWRVNCSLNFVTIRGRSLTSKGNFREEETDSREWKMNANRDVTRQVPLRRMSYCGMLRRVALVRIDVLEEDIASITG
jgi:hypothetical protein